MLNRFLGLRHHAVIGGHHQDNDIRGIGAARTHGGKRGVTGGIKESNFAARGFHTISADMLGNATRFAGYHFGIADIVEQRGFAVINVTHDGHHRRAAGHIHDIAFRFGHHLLFQLIFLEQDIGVPQFFGDQRRGFLIEQLVDGHHRAHLHHHFDQIAGLDAHFLRQIAHGNRFGNTHFTRHRRYRLLELAALALTFAFAATTATRRSITATTAPIILAARGTFTAAFALAGALAGLNMKTRFRFFFIIFALGDIAQGFLALGFKLGFFLGGMLLALGLLAHFFGGIALGFFRFTLHALFFLPGQLRLQLLFRLATILLGFFRLQSFLLATFTAQTLFFLTLFFRGNRILIGARFAVAHRFALLHTLLLGHLLGQLQRA